MISNRLTEIASFLNEDDFVADIGSDHGKLIIYLAKKFPNSFFLAIENKKGPFNVLCNNIKKSGLSNITTSLSNGISVLSDEINALVLAGMGGLNIISIIKSNCENLKNIRKIVFSANNNIIEALLFFESIGFVVEKSKSLIEEDKLYFIFSMQNVNNVDIQCSKSGSVMKIIKAINDKMVYNFYITKLNKKLSAEFDFSKQKEYWEFSNQFCGSYIMREVIYEHKKLIDETI